jgi:hypothetical protein
VVAVDSKIAALKLDAAAQFVPIGNDHIGGQQRQTEWLCATPALQRGVNLIRQPPTWLLAEAGRHEPVAVRINPCSEETAFSAEWR